MRKILIISSLFLSTTCNAQKRLDSTRVAFDTLGNIVRKKYYSLPKQKPKNKVQKQYAWLKQ